MYIHIRFILLLYILYIYIISIIYILLVLYCIYISVYIYIHIIHTYVYVYRHIYISNFWRNTPWHSSLTTACPRNVSQPPMSTWLLTSDSWNIWVCENRMYSPVSSNSIKRGWKITYKWMFIIVHSWGKIWLNGGSSHVRWHRRVPAKDGRFERGHDDQPYFQMQPIIGPQSSDCPEFGAELTSRVSSYSFPFLPTIPFTPFQTIADQPQKRHRAQPFGAPAQKSNGRPAWAAWHSHDAITGPGHAMALLDRAGHATAQTPASTNRFHLLETWESSRTRRTRSRLAPQKGPILDRSLETLKEAVNAQPIIFKYGLPRSYELMQ